MTTTFDLEHAKALTAYAKVKTEQFGDGEVTFHRAQVFFVSPREIANRLHILHLASCGDIPLDLTGVPIESRAHAKKLFAITSFTAITHIGIGEPTKVNQWLSEFSAAMQEIGSTGGLEGIMASLLFRGDSEPEVETAMTAWEATAKDKRPSAGYKYAVAISPDGYEYLVVNSTSLTSAIAEGRMSGKSGDALKALLRGRFEKFAVTNYEACVSGSTIGGAIVGAYLGGPIGFLEGAGVGNLAGQAVCPGIDAAIKGVFDKAGKDEPDPAGDAQGGDKKSTAGKPPRFVHIAQPDGCMPNPDWLLIKNPFSSEKPAVASEFAFGRALLNTANQARSPRLLQSVSALLVARDNVKQALLKNNQFQAVPSVYEGLPTREVREEVRVYLESGDVFARSQIEAVTQDVVGDDGKVIGSQLVGYSIVFASDSRLALMFPRGIMLPPGDPESVRSWLRIFNELEAGDIDVANPMLAAQLRLKQIVLSRTVR